jgi:hypothetical protein
MERVEIARPAALPRAGDAPGKRAPSPRKDKPKKRGPAPGAEDPQVDPRDPESPGHALDLLT